MDQFEKIKTTGELMSFVRDCKDSDVAHKFMHWYIDKIGNDTAVKNVMWCTGNVDEKEGREIARIFGIRYSPLEAWLP